MQDFLVLPHSINAEASLLGCLLRQGDLFEIVDEVGLEESDFYEIKHQKVFNAISTLRLNGKTPDLISVSEFMMTEKTLDNSGGMDFLIELQQKAPIVSNQILKQYTEIILEKSLHRQHILICNESANNSYQENASFDDTIDETTSRLIALSNKRKSSTTIKIKDLMIKESDALKERLEKSLEYVGLPTGFEAIDNMTSGFKPGEMIIIAGRPSMGKTSFAMNMASQMARNGSTVLFFSLEMSSEQLFLRLVSSELQINSKHFQTGKLDEDELIRYYSEEMGKLAESNLYFDEHPKLTIGSLRSKAKKVMKDAGSLDVIFIDYLTLMETSRYKDDLVRQMGYISRNIKLFAKEMGIPIVVLSQLSRKIENRTKKVPLLSDLRDSGGIEQDADVVIFIHREEFYDKETKEKGIAQIYIQKNRSGATGMVKLGFISEYTKFTNLMPEDREYGFK